MATNRPFARNLNLTPPEGTEQVGNLAIGIPTAGFAATELAWYGGPDEELGYVIGKDNPDGQSAADDTTAFLGFWRSAALTDASFIELGNKLLGANHATSSQVKTALNTSGYWTSYGLTTPNPDGEWFFYSDAGSPVDIGPPVNNGNAAFIGGIFAFETFNPNKTGEDAAAFINFSLFDSNGNDYTAQFTDLQDNGGSLSITQNGQTVTYTNGDSQTPVFVIQETQFDGNYFAFSTSNATQTQTTTTNFNLTDPITIAFNNDSLISPIITSNNEYIEVGENLYLTYNN